MIEFLLSADRFNDVCKKQCLLFIWVSVNQ